MRAYFSFCSAAICPDPPEIDHGTVRFTGNCIGDTAHYDCELGFELEGEPYLVCDKLDNYTAAFQPELVPVCNRECFSSLIFTLGSVYIRYAHILMTLLCFVPSALPIDIQCNVTTNSEMTVYSYSCEVMLALGPPTLECTIDGVPRVPCEFAIPIQHVKHTVHIVHVTA